MCIRDRTDTSDGLIADLRHMAAMSGVDIDLSSTALEPFWQALSAAGERLSADPRAWVLGGGEDHALVACFPSAPPPGWRVIGAVLEAATPGHARVLLDGEVWSGAAGWESFGGDC